ncbi:uncharacterized protein LOC117170735 [Belonocnema kinseyi]|uniref:uncharacterized protein LOC117170735 n=1 Tax=Belonocnema kinseyi TaxID=2817044 RepID=UPI00143DBDD9|nr:uncharacterized protein LOC117170735 [Belonocnema kinseyi]
MSTTIVNLFITTAIFFHSIDSSSQAKERIIAINKIPGLIVPEGQPIIWQNKMIGKLNFGVVLPLIQDERFFTILRQPSNHPEHIRSVEWLVYISNWIDEMRYPQELLRTAAREVQRLNSVMKAAQEGRVLIDPPRRAISFNGRNIHRPAARHTVHPVNDFEPPRRAFEYRLNEHMVYTPRPDRMLLKQMQRRRNT